MQESDQGAHPQGKRRGARKKRRTEGRAITDKTTYPATIVPERRAKSTARWLECTMRQVHLISACPACTPSGSGLLFATFENNLKGRVTAKCLDCNTEVDYYVEAGRNQVWEMRLVEASGVKL